MICAELIPPSIKACKMRCGSRRKSGFSTNPVKIAVTTPISPAMAGLLPAKNVAINAAMGKKTNAEFNQSRAVNTGRSSGGRVLISSRMASA